VTKPGRPLIRQVRSRVDPYLPNSTPSALCTCRINGLPGFVTREADGEIQTTALAIEDGRISAIYVMRNPDKLRHLH